MVVLPEIEVHNILQELVPIYYHYNMLESILHKTEIEQLEYVHVSLQLKKYLKILQEILPNTPASLQEQVELYIRKLQRCFPFHS